MNVEQQKGTTHHGGRGDGGTEPSPHGQQQALTAFDSQRALTNHLMEQVCDPQNLVRAYRRGSCNKGKAGGGGGDRAEQEGWPRDHPSAGTSFIAAGALLPPSLPGGQVPKTA